MEPDASRLGNDPGLANLVPGVHLGREAAKELRERRRNLDQARFRELVTKVLPGLMILIHQKRTSRRVITHLVLFLRPGVH